MEFETSKSLIKINQTDIYSLSPSYNLKENLRDSKRKNKTSKFLERIKDINLKTDNKEVTKNIDYNNHSGKYLYSSMNNNMNLNTYNESVFDNILNHKQNISSQKKISLIKNPKINDLNIIINSKKSARDQLFKTEIKEKIKNLRDESKKSDFSTTAFTKFFQNQRNNSTMKNNSKIQSQKSTQENALLIPKEDMIFEEMKNYKCFKYFTKESLARTSVPFIYINMNMDTTKNNPPKKNKNNNPYQINFNNDLKKFIDYDEPFLSKNNQIFFSEEKKRKILDNVYKVPTAEDMYEKINMIKNKKDKKKLKNYQYNFLKVVKHNITEKYYEDLRDKFNNIRELAKGRYKTNFKFIKEIEKNEEKVIKDINKTFENFMKYSSRRNIKNILNKPGSRLDLPQIKFEKIINKEEFEHLKTKNNQMRKSNFISLSENKSMNRTSIKLKKKSILNINDFSFNKNMMKTSPKTFSKFRQSKAKI